MSAAGIEGRAVIRLVQVSDTHLSRARGYFVENYRVFLDEMARERPDVVIHSGDVSLNGPDEADDLAFARAELDRLPAPWLAVAGNHDTGEAPRHARLDQPLDAARLARWRQHIGDIWWQHDVGAWRIIGLESALFASDLPDEARQFAFLRAALTTRGHRPVMVVLHMPPFVDAADDPAFTTSALPFEARAGFLDLCASEGVRIITCGHCHVYRTIDHRGMRIVWAPGTAFVNMAREFARRGNFPRPGYIRWTLDGLHAGHELIEPARMFACDVGRWNDEVGSTTKLPRRPWQEPTIRPDVTLSPAAE